MTTILSSNAIVHQNESCSMSCNEFKIVPYDWKLFFCNNIINNGNRTKITRCLCVEGKGIVKYYLFHILSHHFKGITTWLSPLLTICSDQYQKLKSKIASCPNTKTMHVYLGAFQSKSYISKLILLLHSMDESCSDILFTSPQTITEMHPIFLHL